jgi:two-component system LytT family response regulator
MKSFPQKFALQTLDQMIFVSPSDILYCLSEGAYTYVHLTNEKKVLVTKNLKEIESTLLNTNDQFFRIHRSCVINLDYATNYLNNGINAIIMKNGERFSLSRSRKKEFLSLFVRL